ncbi:MAG TPA: hypothetical protein ENH28_02030 [Euryarchaeota archaeon]|nr:DsrE/DsrF-like family protein [archaeon BMS3Bbin15]HDL14927.1 hypothetical protein [Euryarchaeota archaeon]
MGNITIGILTRPYGSRNIAFVLKLSKAAVEKGHSVKLWLSADSTTVLKKNQHKYKKTFHFEDDIKELLEKGVEIVACESCVEMRGVTKEDLIEGVPMKTMTWFMEAALTADASLLIGEE